MKEQTKYDVFISYSRKDYVVNDEIISGNPISAILELFDKNDVKYWFDKDGIYSGEEFVKEISTAIVNSKMLVFVSSKNSNESEYTCGEILKAKKTKKLIIPFLIDECEYNEKFEILLLPLNHIDYVNQPNTALPELLRTVNKEKERIRLIEEKQNEEILKEQKKQEISAGVKDFQRLNGEQDFLLRSLYSKSKDVGAKTKCCPICDREVSIDVPFCESCGWSFASLYGIYGVDGKLLHDEKQLQIVRGLWQDLKEGKDSKAHLEEIADNLDRERKEKEMYARQSDKLKAAVHSLEQEKQAQQERLRLTELELHETIDELNRTRKELETNIKLYDNAKEENIELEKRAKRIEQKYMELKLRMEEVEERKFAEEKREAERKAEEEQKCRDAEQRTKEMTFIVGGVSFKMIRVEGGSFMMGSPDNDSDAQGDEKPQHRVTLSDYYIGETQVTQALWEAVMGGNPSLWKGNNLPVEQVSWKVCQEFIKQLNKKTGKTFRLPTEAEWEYAARGGRKSQCFKYVGGNDIDKVAWYDGNSGVKTHSVKQKNANELGLYDMTGNVWEWCQDWFGSYSGSSQTNPTGPSTGSNRVLRGGSWSNSARICRVATRSYYSPDYRRSGIGFRLALVCQ
jgi:formylglycine-generating enzyme required for sulfatase activity